MNSGLIIQPQIFWQLLLVKLPELSIYLMLQALQHLIYQMILTRSGILVFFINLNLTEILVMFSALFLQVSVADGLGWFSVGNLLRSSSKTLVFLRVPFLVIIFSCCILMIFLIVVSAVLPSIDILICSIAIYSWLLLRTLSVIRILICGKLFWLLYLNMTYEAKWNSVERGLLILLLAKSSLLHLIIRKRMLNLVQITMVLLMWICPECKIIC